jgi:hypothetical protein
MVIGIKTYTEHIETNIELPAHLNLIIREANTIHMEGTFWSAQILNSRVAYVIISDKNDVQSLRCQAEESLELNGANKSSDFEYSGSGDCNLLVRSNEIHLTIEDGQ